MSTATATATATDEKMTADPERRPRNRRNLKNLEVFQVGSTLAAPELESRFEASSHATCKLKLSRELSHEKFEDFERRLESEPAVPDLKYRLAKSRLPVDSPYVGNFHRGYKLCKRQFLDDASQKDLQLSNCPYIDTTMFDCEPLSSSRKRPQTE